jgi:hypothetical protein
MPKQLYPCYVLVALNGDGKKKLPYVNTISGNSTMGDEYSNEDSGNCTVEENSTKAAPEICSRQCKRIFYTK